MSSIEQRLTKQLEAFRNEVNECKTILHENAHTPGCSYGPCEEDTGLLQLFSLLKNKSQRDINSISIFQLDQLIIS